MTGQILSHLTPAGKVLPPKLNNGTHTKSSTSPHSSPGRQGARHEAFSRRRTILSEKMDTCLPPSPQWNQPHSACLHYISEQEGWLLYSLNNAIHVVNPFSLKYHALLRSNSAARINCIASCPHSPVQQQQSDQQRLSPQASIGTEPPSPSPSVSTQDQIDTDLEWGIQTNGVGDGSNNSPSDISTETSILARELIASGGEDGRVVCWDIVSQSTVATLQGTHQVRRKE